MPGNKPENKVSGLSIDPLFLTTLGDLTSTSAIQKQVETNKAERSHAGKPSVAVLPFDNMSGDPDQNYFSDGITEDIITELSRFRSLYVIARNSSFAFRGKPISITEVGTKLGVEYVVEGSVRKVGNRVRITAQLIDVASGNHAWAERYDRGLEDIFAVQDEVASVIASTLSGQVEIAIAKRATRNPTDNFMAYDYVLRGIQHHQKFTPADNMEAATLLKTAIELDPQYAEAYAWLALTHAEIWYSTLSSSELQAGIDFAKKAVGLDDNNARCHLIAGYCYLLQKQFEKADYHHRRAILLNPNDPHVGTHMGYLLAVTGRVSESSAWFERGSRLNPYPPVWYFVMRGVSAFIERRYSEAIDLFLNGSQARDYVYLAASSGHLGQFAKAAEYLAQHATLNSKLSVFDFARSEPFSRQEDFDNLIEGLRKAGA